MVTVYWFIGAGELCKASLQSVHIMTTDRYNGEMRTTMASQPIFSAIIIITIYLYLYNNNAEQTITTTLSSPDPAGPYEPGENELQNFEDSRSQLFYCKCMNEFSVNRYKCIDAYFEKINRYYFHFFIWTLVHYGNFAISPVLRWFYLLHFTNKGHFIYLNLYSFIQCHIITPMT